MKTNAGCKFKGEYWLDEGDSIYVDNDMWTCQNSTLDQMSDLRFMKFCNDAVMELHV